MKLLLDTHLIIMGSDQLSVVARPLLDNDYQELAISSEHAVFIDTLPPIHKDPFGHILVAQATVEDIILLTADALMAKYPGPVRQV